MGAFLTGVVVASMTACQDAAALSPLENAASSEEELITSVLDALAAEDGEWMARHLVTKAEYETLLWPEMPDKEYTPFEFIWGMSYPRTRKGHSQALDRYGGLDMEFISVEYTKEPEVYQSFTLHKGARVIVRRLDNGEIGEVPVFDVLVRHAGGWKMLNYDEL